MCVNSNAPRWNEANLEPYIETRRAAVMDCNNINLNATAGYK
jgi:hypothetical protein